MPRGDGTGPMGMGAMTGRGAGFCAASQNVNSGFARGFGCGHGVRQMSCHAVMPGWKRMYNPDNAEMNRSELSEKEFLLTQAKFFENRLLQVKERLSSISKVPD